MTPERIKLIILDFDGTLYDINDVIKTVYQQQVSFLSFKLNKSCPDIESFFSQNDVFPYITKESKSATELFARLGISIEEWKEYRNKYFDVNAIQKDKAVKESVICSLALNSKVILLSSNTMSTIKKVLSHLYISPKHFSEIICSDYFPSELSFNKKNIMEYLSTKYTVPFESMISIGDRYQTDIRPMLELGGKGILLISPKSLGKVAKDLLDNKLCSCEEYELMNNIYSPI